MVYAWAMRKILLLLLILVACPLLAKDFYKVITPDGEVIYSDTYIPGAERIRVIGSKTTSAEGADSEGEAAVGTFAEGSIYTNFEIMQPENEQTIRSDEGNINVGLLLTPGLAAGHSIQVFIDGTRIAGEMRSTQFSLNGLTRGSHSLKINVVDDQGSTLAEAPGVVFHLRKSAIDTPEER
jgi:hypothetical protein